jgi:hypothetical protein
LIEFIKYLENNQLIKKYNKNYWDIFAVVDKNGKSKRVNKKSSEPIPHNSRRVSKGMQFIVYYDENFFDDINNFAGDIIRILEKNSQPIEQNKPKSKILKTDNQENSKFDYSRWKSNHKNYWLDIIEKIV